MCGGPVSFLLCMTRNADGCTEKVRNAPRAYVEGFLGLASRPLDIAGLAVPRNAVQVGWSSKWMIVLLRAGSVRLENRWRSGADLGTHPSARLVAWQDLVLPNRQARSRVLYGVLSSETIDVFNTEEMTDGEGSG